jgi:hypothetical protein
MKYLLKISLTYTKNYALKIMHGASAAHALLPNLRIYTISLSCVIVNKYYQGSVQVFGAFTGFL